MRRVDLILKARRIYTEGNLIDGCIAVKNGKIVGIFTADINIEASEVIDVGNNLVLPGIVDPHVHLRDPGCPERETFMTGTMAAAAGGVTTICEHPISIPPQYSPQILRNRLKVARNQAMVDYAFFGAAGADHLEEIIPLSKEGIIAYKTFLHAAPPGREKEFEGLTMQNDGEILKGFKEISKTGLICVVHAENNEIIQSLIKEYKEKGKTYSLAHAETRPPISETETISRIIKFAEYTDARVQIAHISLPESVELVKEAKQKGLEIYAETCPHYLFLNEEHLEKLGPFAKCNPPLRTREANKALLKQVADGDVDFIGSDHGPFLKSEKEKGLKDIFAAPAGMPGIEATLPLLYTQVKKGRLTLERMVQMVSENPAKIYGLYPRKGTIKVGADADMVVIETDTPYIIKKENLLTKARDIALVYDGWEVYGKPLKTFVRGKAIFEDGKVNESHVGWGEFITPLK